MLAGTSGGRRLCSRRPGRLRRAPGRSRGRPLRGRRLAWRRRGCRAGALWRAALRGPPALARALRARLRQPAHDVRRSRLGRTVARSLGRAGGGSGLRGLGLGPAGRGRAGRARLAGLLLSIHAFCLPWWFSRGVIGGAPEVAGRRARADNACGAYCYPTSLEFDTRGFRTVVSRHTAFASNHRAWRFRAKSVRNQQLSR